MMVMIVETFFEACWCDEYGKCEEHDSKRIEDIEKACIDRPRENQTIWCLTSESQLNHRKKIDLKSFREKRETQFEPQLSSIFKLSTDRTRALLFLYRKTEILHLLFLQLEKRFGGDEENILKMTQLSTRNFALNGSMDGRFDRSNNRARKGEKRLKERKMWCNELW